MNIRSTSGLFVALLVLAISGCNRNAVENKTDSAPAPGSQAAGELAGTTWHLVKIMSMDDSEHVPEDPSKYTLSFDGDDGVSIVADCNRGTGNYSSESPGQLQFGVIAATQALCPPPSLHDVYMKQFEWVRSYVLEDGHLFLATMADGSIIEFEPAQGASGNP
jgi:heat shock protein HslJ